VPVWRENAAQRPDPSSFFLSPTSQMTNLITHFLFAQFEILTPNLDRLHQLLPWISVAIQRHVTCQYNAFILLLLQNISILGIAYYSIAETNVGKRN
jgi:hypothetical protein